MKLEPVLENLNSFEKNSFLKIIESIIAENPRNLKQINEILSTANSELKYSDSAVIVKVFNLLTDEYADHVREEFVNTTSQIDILTDILIRDGNSIMKHDWFARLYEDELKHITKKVKALSSDLKNQTGAISETRSRDYSIYQECVKTAYLNDELNNQDRKVTWDEQSILITLSEQLGLSQEEVKLINYSVIAPSKFTIEEIIDQLKGVGILFYSKRKHTAYVPDEIVRVLRKVRGKEVADKFFRRTLKLLREPQINLVCRRHNIDWKQPLDVKIKEIINEGISFSGLLTNDIYKDGTSLTERKKFLNEFCEKGLMIMKPVPFSDTAKVE